MFRDTFTKGRFFGCFECHFYHWASLCFCV